MVLLTMLAELAGETKTKFAVAHFNHQLRGRASDADEHFVQAAARRLKLRCEIGRGDVKRFAKEQGISIEMAGRQLRHEFLAKTARRLKCSVIATAHHADDQVELFFLRLLRAAGGEGLAGMKWSAVSPADARVRIGRPLLEVSRAELLEFAEKNKIRFREDASNASRDFLRNRIRHELLPLLRSQYQPGLDGAVRRLMDLVGAEAEAVRLAAEVWLQKEKSRSPWESLPAAVQRRVVQIQLRRLKIEPEFEWVESLRLEAGKLITVGAGLLAVRDENGIVRLVKPEQRTFRRGELRLNLKDGGTVLFAGRKIRWNFEEAKWLSLRKKPAQTEFFDADRIGSTVILRHWRPGDRFQPIGMKAAVKLQDWFTNQKIPAERRRELILATTAAGEIFWIEGLRIGERFKLASETRHGLIWRFLER